MNDGREESALRPMNGQEPKIRPLQLTAAVAGAVFAIETLVMFILPLLRLHSPWLETFIDSGMLVVALIPVLYAFVLRPLTSEMGAARLADSRYRELLERSRSDLEAQVAERTAELAAANETLRAEIHRRAAAESEKDKLQAQLLQAQKMEAVGRLAGGIAHDFNNILTAITGFVSLIVAELPPNCPIEGDVQEIKRAVDRASRLTGQLLSFGRKRVLQPELLSLNRLVADIQEMLRQSSGENVSLRVGLDPRLGQVRADKAQIEQVLVNLAVNSKDAMPDGGEILFETRHIPASEVEACPIPSPQRGDYARLSVKDTGQGMDENVRKHVFEPFFTTKGKDKGTGLGLATAYGIVKQFGGHIDFQSEPGKGATFNIYLPTSGTAAENRVSCEAVPGTADGTETILVVEDEEMVRRIAARVLSKSGYSVLEAPNGAEALRIFQENREKIALVLTDIIMPGMNGREVAERVASLRPGTKVLLMSGHTDDTLIHQGVFERKTNFIQKPFTPDDLLRKVRDTLDAPAAPGAARKV